MSDGRRADRLFGHLGAVPAATKAAVSRAPEPSAAWGRLTPREVEVRRLVATGVTNRKVADELVIRK